MRVLVSSDDTSILEQFEDLPQLAAHELVVTTRPDEIAEQARSAEVIVLDLDGHEQDVMDLLERLAQASYRGRVVLLSQRDPRELNYANAVGSQRHLNMGVPQCKPLDKARILDGVLGLLSPETLNVQPKDIRAALDAEQLVIFYHPLKHIETDTVYAAEALVRWQHPEYGLLNPDYIIPVAEEHDLIADVTRYVIRTALEQYAAWRDQGWNFQMAVNVSAQLLRDPHFVTEVDEAIRSAGVRPENLALEITESQTLSQQTEIINALTRLMFLGVKLSIDDFGTGYSSLSRLVSMPFHEVKIDKSFVMKGSLRLADHERNTAKQVMRDQAETVVHAITNLGHNLGLKVIAEGVATREAWDMVEKLECDVAQGFFISVPLCAAEFSRWLDREGTPRSLFVDEKERLEDQGLNGQVVHSAEDVSEDALDDAAPDADPHTANGSGTSRDLRGWDSARLDEEADEALREPPPAA